MTAPPGDGTAAASLEEVEFLARSPHRVAVLEELTDGPLDRAALRDATGASAPTIGRILGDFEDRRWLVREAATAELTPLGEFVADQFLDLREAMGVERKLRDVWRWLPREMEAFSVDLFADAVVSYPGPGYPYQPVERMAHLIDEADSMRGFGATMVKSSNLGAACQSIVSGLDFEYIYDPAVFEAVVSWNPDRVGKAMACENCTTLFHESLPDGGRCGLDLFDDRVAICCHDGSTGALEAVVDTDAPTALEWAESVYQQLRSEASPVGDAGIPVMEDAG